MLRVIIMILLFASDKGGVGKSTTAVNIAVMLVNNDKNVIILKTDKNPDLLNWAEIRREAELTTIPVFEAYGNVISEIIRIKRMCDVLIIDCAGHVSAEFRSALTIADVVITLIKPSSMFEKGTLTKLTETIRDPALKNPNLKSHLLMTRIKHNKIKDALELEQELCSDSIWIQPLKTKLSELDIFENAVNLGAGVHEVERGSSLGKAKGQLELIGKEIGLI